MILSLHLNFASATRLELGRDYAKMSVEGVDPVVFAHFEACRYTTQLILEESIEKMGFRIHLMSRVSKIYSAYPC